VYAAAMHGPRGVGGRSRCWNGRSAMPGRRRSGWAALAGSVSTSATGSPTPDPAARLCAALAHEDDPWSRELPQNRPEDRPVEIAAWARPHGGEQRSLNPIRHVR
jgi:hypothetical protein